MSGGDRDRERPPVAPTADEQDQAAFPEHRLSRLHPNPAVAAALYKKGIQRRKKPAQQHEDAAQDQAAVEPGTSDSSGPLPQMETAPEAGPGGHGRPATPPEIAAMDADLVDKLWSSRTAIAAKRPELFKDKTDDQFWEAMQLIGAADLHTLQVVTRGAKAVGVWPHVETIVNWYTYASSYAIEFLGDPAGITGGGDWGKDYPQSMVRREHGNTAHDWYRNDSGAGNPGMHLGVDAGAGFQNVHWDPTNPMDHVGDGIPHLGLVPGLPFPVPTFEPKGQAIYSPMALVAHAAEIGKFGEGIRNLLKKPNTPTEKFLTIAYGKDQADKAKEFGTLEEKAPDKSDRGRSDAVVAEIRRAASAVLDVHAAAQPLALVDDATAQPQLDDLVAKLNAAAGALYDALAALIVFLKDEAGVTGDYPFDTAAKWAADAVWQGYDTIVGLQKQRSEKNAKK
jgi:hypothetical protein